MLHQGSTFAVHWLFAPTRPPLPVETRNPNTFVANLKRGTKKGLIKKIIKICAFRTPTWFVFEVQEGTYHIALQPNQTASSCPCRYVLKKTWVESEIRNFNSDFKSCTKWRVSTITKILWNLRNLMKIPWILRNLGKIRDTFLWK